MRIIAGTAGGRRLDAPSGTATRPTSDRAREAMFSTLGGLIDLDGARVLDLYAGSGALGLEALSRGAVAADLVDSDPRAAATIRANAAALGLSGARVHAGTVARYCERAAEDPTPVDLLLADPPYDLPTDELAQVLSKLTERLSRGAVVVVERSSRDPDWVWPTPLEALRVKRYGAGALWYGRRP
ncbi:MAG: 16S rRNA (guanine(966)-N(2))-methyltransferase RsmD [Geodermatophilaceae bacterium]|nr:16S rRNA (guanine(966)-N(2))-methyltransferase RsmD [Geodermatophilaceae bacterium]